MIQKSTDDSEKASGALLSLTDNIITRWISGSNIKTKECQMTEKTFGIILHSRLLLEWLSYPRVMALNIHTGPVQCDGRTTLWDWPSCGEAVWILKLWCGTTALQNWHFMAVQRKLHGYRCRSGRDGHELLALQVLNYELL